MAEKLTKPNPPYPACWFSGGNGRSWSVWEEGVLLSRHRTEQDARARVEALEQALAGRLALQETTHDR